MGLPSGSSYYAEFTTVNPTTGAAQNADALPTATATHNGTDDATFTLTVTNLATGRYKVTGTVPAGYAVGDMVQVSAAATVATVAGVAVIDSFMVDATVNSRSTYAGGAVASVTGNVGGNVVGSVGSVAGNVTGSVASVTAPVTIATATVLAAPRALDAIADGSIQLNDALWCAVAAATGKESVTGTSYVVKTPSTGTTLRTFTLDSATAPTQRN